MEALTRWLEDNGFSRAATVREPGEYAVRGGILDLFAAGAERTPVRLDFFGDTLESIRAFDMTAAHAPASGSASNYVPVSEMRLNRRAIEPFPQAYVAQFGAADRTDLLYHAVSEGRRYAGMEHWLPLFLGEMETLFDYHPGRAGRPRSSGRRSAHGERLDRSPITTTARKQRMDGQASGGGAPYKPLPPDRLYLTADDWTRRLGRAAVVAPVAVRRAARARSASTPAAASAATSRPSAASQTSTSSTRSSRHIKALHRRRASGVVVACLERRLARPHGAGARRPRSDGESRRSPTGRGAWRSRRERRRLPCSAWRRASRPTTLAVIGEQDMLGDRLVRPHSEARRRRLPDRGHEPRRRRPRRARRPRHRPLRRAEDDRGGAARRTIASRSTTPAATKLYLPVENIELLSRYGSEETGRPARPARRRRLAVAQGADQEAPARHGGAADQDRRRARQLKAGPGARSRRRAPTTSSRRAFPMRRPRTRTPAIDAVLDDLGAGKPMDRLICGDVGFGKTEVALRAALRRGDGGQAGCGRRADDAARPPAFQDIPAALRRPAGQDRASLAPGRRQGAGGGEGGDRRRDASTLSSAPMRCSARRSRSRDLGLLVVDEEQHFGVKHKERLKELKDDVHVLTLSATPIPRTLQLALDGRARAVADHHAAGRSPRGAHLHLAVRSGGRARGAAARALSRRPELLRLPRIGRSRRAARVPAPSTCPR